MSQRGLDPTYSDDRQGARYDLAICPTCRGTLDFPTDGMGEVLDASCSRCRQRSRLLASIRPLSPTPIPTPAKLESREDLHRTATQPKKEGLAPAPTPPPMRDEPSTPNTPSATTKCAPKYGPKVCPCGVTYTPSGPRQIYHALDCPARQKAAEAPGAQLSISFIDQEPESVMLTDVLTVIDSAIIALRLARQQLAANPVGTSRS